MESLSSLRKILSSRRLRRYGLLLLGMTAALFLFSAALSSFLHQGDPPFQALASQEESPALHWTFITPYGEEDPSYRAMFPSQEECAQRAGIPVEITYCAMEKYLNMTAAGMSADVVTCWYTDPNFKRLETSRSVWSLQELLDQEIPGFVLPEDFIQWCGNFQGHVYAYPHTPTILSVDDSATSNTVMIARKDLLEHFHWDSQDFASKDSVLEQLKTIRKATNQVIPCYLEFSCLQQMFGVSAETATGWQDTFFHAGTLEALQYMNTLYRERLLSPDVFTLSEETLLGQLGRGELFLVSSPQLGSLLSRLPEDHPILEQYVEVTPIHSDSGRNPAFANNFDEQYASTLFVKNSVQGQTLARLLAGFYLENMGATQEQAQALRAAGMGDLLEGDVSYSPLGLESAYTVPVTHYEILFSHYSNTRLATVADRRNTYLQTQVVNIVEDCTPEEVAQAYQSVVWELQSGDYRILQDWKQSRYEKAMDILQAQSSPVQPS